MDINGRISSLVGGNYSEQWFAPNSRQFFVKINTCSEQLLTSVSRFILEKQIRHNCYTMDTFNILFWLMNCDQILLLTLF